MKVWISWERDGRLICILSLSVLNKFSLRSFKVDDQEKIYLVNGEPLTALNPVSRTATATGQSLGILHTQKIAHFTQKTLFALLGSFFLKRLLIFF